MSIKSCEFEKEINLILVDALYSTKGKVIYSEIIKSSAEFSYLAGMINREVGRDLKSLLNKAFHVNFSDIDFSEQMLGQRVYVRLTVDELKEFLINRRLPVYNPSIIDENFPGAITMEEGNTVIVAVKAEKKVSGRDNPVITFWGKSEFEKIFIEFVLTISVMSLADAETYTDMNEDERTVDILSDGMNLPSESVAMIKNLEREIFEKFADHERRVWGELEPGALVKYKMHQDELTKLHGSLNTLKVKIEEERGTQEKILKEMREALINSGGTKLY